MKLIAKPAPDHNGDANVEGDDGGDWQVIKSILIKVQLIMFPRIVSRIFDF